MKVFLTILLSLLPLQSTSFAPAVRLSVVTHGVQDGLIRPASSLTAKKRRRRKADASPVPTTQQSDELPDFDDGEAETDEEASVVVAAAATEKAASPAQAFKSTSTTTPTEIKRGSGLNSQLAEEVGGNVEGLDEDTILEAMRGKASSGAWQPPRTIQDTLSDRSLEKFMDFDKMIEADGSSGDVVDLPEFDEVIARRKQREAASAMQEGRVQDAAMLMDTAGMGKKAARNAQRKAAAMQREAELEEEKNPFEDLNILKLLENGAWVGIGLLVVWEFYINSPFFERAAPLIPVVYDNPTPPGM